MKERLDILLTRLDTALSREKAKAMIMSGDVFVDGQRADKAGAMVDDSSEIEIKSKPEFVSRGGYKLKKAVEVFNIKLEGKNCIDVGASTGGFTDCMLQNKAKHVIAIDVGYGQFDYGLRKDPRVTCLERTNIRKVEPDSLPYRADFAAVDVAFISLSKVLPVLKGLMKAEYEIVCLIKPQFEAGKELVGKNGVVRDKAVQIDVINKIAQFSIDNGFVVNAIDFSPIKGPKGNIEFLMYLSSDLIFEKPFDFSRINEIVETAKESAE